MRFLLKNVLILTALLLFTPLSVLAEEDPLISYSSFLAGVGWTEAVTDGTVSGTTGEARKMEAIRVETNSEDLTLRYRSHVEDYGWLDWVESRMVSGTTDENKRLEALSIELSGALSGNYDIYYRTHISDFGWLGWAKNGEDAGSEGLAKQVEAVQILLLPKGSEAPGTTELPFLNRDTETTAKPEATDGDISGTASAHIGDVGWQDFDLFNITIGTTGENKKLEALKLNFDDPDTSSIEYTSHLADIGWEENWKKSGEISGTTGENRAMQAVKIRLTGPKASIYNIYYRAHAQELGWMDWAKNGEPAGTTRANLNLEAIEIVLVDKNAEAPGRTDEPCRTPISVEDFKGRIHGCWIEAERAEEPLKSYVSGISNAYLYFGQHGTFNGLEGRYEVLTASATGGRIKFIDGFTGQKVEAYMDFKDLDPNRLRVRIDGIDEREMILGDTTDGIHYTFSGLMQNGQLAVIELREKP